MSHEVGSRRSNVRQEGGHRWTSLELGRLLSIKRHMEVVISWAVGLKLTIHAWLVKQLHERVVGERASAMVDGSSTLMQVHA